MYTQGDHTCITASGGGSGGGGACQNMGSAGPELYIHLSNMLTYVHWEAGSGHPTSPFPIIEPENPWIGEFCVIQEHRETDFKAPNL